MHCPESTEHADDFRIHRSASPRHPWPRAPVADDRQRATRLRRSSIRGRQGTSRQS